VTDQTSALSGENAPAEKRRGSAVGRTFMWLGIAGASAALTAAVAVVVIRAALRRPQPGDETTDRIQALIDEANRLIKTLDEKKTT
jgi:ABC-type Fe3+ transport system permease subunit